MKTFELRWLRRPNGWVMPWRLQYRTRLTSTIWSEWEDVPVVDEMEGNDHATALLVKGWTTTIRGEEAG